MREQIHRGNLPLGLRTLNSEAKPPGSQFGFRDLRPTGVEALSGLSGVSAQDTLSRTRRRRSARWQRVRLKATVWSPAESSLRAELHLCADNGVFVFVFSARFNVLAGTEIMENCWMLLCWRL